MVPATFGSSFIWMMAARLGDVYWLSGMSRLVQAPAVKVLVTPFSAPPPISETLMLATSAVHTSRCTVALPLTFCGVFDQSMPSYSAVPPKVYFSDALLAMVGSLKTTAGLWPQFGALSMPARVLASL